MNILTIFHSHGRERILKSEFMVKLKFNKTLKIVKKWNVKILTLIKQKLKYAKNKNKNLIQSYFQHFFLNIIIEFSYADNTISNTRRLIMSLL